jgi:tetratricopeptide (TPR) repeat protein
MEKKHDILRVVHHYFASEHYHEVVRVITSPAPVDVKYLPVTFLKLTFDQIPCLLMAQNAQLLCLRAKIMSLSGETKQAEGDFQTAIRLFHEDKDASGTANCRKEMGFHYYLTGNLVGAIQELEGVWNQPSNNPLILEENPYGEWLLEERESLKMRYLETLARIIRIYEKKESWHQCIQYCEMYLIHDPFAEPFYRKLMRLHAKTGNRLRMIQTFEKCRTKLNDILDCPVSNATLELLEALKNNGQ